MALLLSRETLQDHVGKVVGVSPWVSITQENVNAFADITLDPQYIHTDPEKASKTPFGGTIAHGFLTLSMLSYFSESGAGTSIENATMGINYGFDKLRFLNPVRVGKRIRGRAKLVSVDEAKLNHFRFKHEISVEIEGEERPALVAEWLTMSIT